MTSKEIIKSSFRNKNNNLITTYIYLVLPLVAGFLVVTPFNLSEYIEMVGVLMKVVSIFVIPSLILHYQYNIYSKHICLEIDDVYKKIKYNNKFESFIFNFSDVILLEKFYTFALYKNRLGWIPWDSYNYVKIHLKNGGKIIITSFLADKFDLHLPSDKKVIHKVYFPYIRK